MKLLPNRSVVPSPTRLALILIASITGLVAIWPVLTLVREALTSLHSGFSDPVSYTHLTLPTSDLV